MASERVLFFFFFFLVCLLPYSFLSSSSPSFLKGDLLFSEVARIRGYFPGEKKSSKKEENKEGGKGEEEEKGEKEELEKKENEKMREKKEKKSLFGKFL